MNEGYRLFQLLRNADSLEEQQKARESIRDFLRLRGYRQTKKGQMWVKDSELKRMGMIDEPNGTLTVVNEKVFNEYTKELRNVFKTNIKRKSEEKEAMDALIGNADKYI